MNSHPSPNNPDVIVIPASKPNDDPSGLKAILEYESPEIKLFETVSEIKKCNQRIDEIIQLEEALSKEKKTLTAKLSKLEKKKQRLEKP